MRDPLGAAPTPPGIRQLDPITLRQRHRDGETERVEVMVAQGLLDRWLSDMRQAGRAASRCCLTRSSSSRLCPTCGGAFVGTSAQCGRSGRDDLASGEVRHH